jgi:uncharacterized protein involved in oxidation of intracellular sulfur
MKVLVILNDGAYGTERSYNGLRLTLAILKGNDAEVRIFLIGDAVTCAVAGQVTPDGYYNLERMIRAVVRRGVEVGCCGTCMDARGDPGGDARRGRTAVLDGRARRLDLAGGQGRDVLRTVVGQQFSWSVRRRRSYSSSSISPRAYRSARKSSGPRDDSWRSGRDAILTRAHASTARSTQKEIIITAPQPQSPPHHRHPPPHPIQARWLTLERGLGALPVRDKRS